MSPLIETELETVTTVNVPRTAFGRQFTQREPDSITDEDGDLLYALVRMRKPNFVVETGTGHAIATKRLAEALKANGLREQSLERFGMPIYQPHVLSCDTDLDYVVEAQKLSRSLPIEVWHCPGLYLLDRIQDQPEFIFIDAGDSENRLSELKFIVEHKRLAKQGILVIHDAVNPKYAEVIDYAIQRFRYLLFDGLQGLGVFQAT